jgi:hypothetical protein
VRDDTFAISDDIDRTKQIKFDAGSMAPEASVTIKAGAGTSGNVVITLPAENTTLGAGGGGNAFTTIQADSGTSPTASGSTDVLTVTGSNGIATSGNSTNDTLTISGAALETAIAAEETAREAADAALQASIDSLSAIAPEVSAFCEFKEDFLTSWGSNLWGTNNWVQAVSGSGAAVSMVSSFTAQNPGVIALATGTTTTGSACIVASNSGVKFFGVGAGVLSFDHVVKLEALSDGTNTYSVSVGLGLATVTDTPVDAIRWRYSNGLNGGNWTLSCTSASSTTNRDSGVAATTNFVRLGWIANAAGTSIQGYINGVAVGDPITTNIPTGMLQPFNYIIKSAGGTSRTLYIDAVNGVLVFTTPR